MATYKSKSLTLKQNAALEEAKNTKFVIDKTSEEKIYNLYFSWCQSVALPFIKVRPRIKYAAVQVDMLTTRKRLNDRGQAEIKAFFRTFIPQGIQGIREVIGQEICSIDGILLKDARSIAEKLFLITTSPENTKQI